MRPSSYRGNQKVRPRLIQLDRCDDYLFYARNLVSEEPTIVDIGSFSGSHASRLYERLGGRIIVYEASERNFASLVDALQGLPIITRHAAVTGTDGDIELFEFIDKPASTSIYPRHKRQRKQKLERRYVTRGLSVESVLAENNIDHIDILFSNCEGAELGILNEIVSKPWLQEKLYQMCISFHGGRIYDQSEADALLDRLAKTHLIIEDDSKWPCHLFLQKSILF
jgi:FkbM family methyltransferase